MTGAEETTAGDDAYVLQYDTSAEVLSERRFGDEGSPEQIYAIASHPTGGMFVVGSSSAELNGASTGWFVLKVSE